MSEIKLLGKDLRIDNLVTINNEKSWPQLKGKPLRVIGVKELTDMLTIVAFPLSKYTVSLMDEDRNEYNQLDQFIEPIPLSEDVLVKLGFEKTKWINCYILNNVDVFFTRVKNDNSLHLDDFSHINSAHRLQNHYYENTNQELIYTP